MLNNYCLLAEYVLVELLHEHLPGVLVRDVAQHHGRVACPAAGIPFEHFGGIALRLRLISVRTRLSRPERLARLGCLNLRLRTTKRRKRKVGYLEAPDCCWQWYYLAFARRPVCRNDRQVIGRSPQTGVFTKTLAQHKQDSPFGTVPRPVSLPTPESRCALVQM